MAYIQTQKLHKPILALSDCPNDENYCEKECKCICWIKSISQWSNLSLLMRETSDDGRETLQILREQYLSK